MARVPDPQINPSFDGDRPMSIARRMVRERERLIGMTDEERAWRKKWLEAQILDPEEPIMSKEYYKEMYNPLRRFYKWPMNKFQEMLEPRIGLTAAYVSRHMISKSFMMIIGMYCLWYHLKYNRMQWTRVGGWKVLITRGKMYPDNKNMDLVKTRGNQFYVNGFDKSPI